MLGQSPASEGEPAWGGDPRKRHFSWTGRREPPGRFLPGGLFLTCFALGGCATAGALRPSTSGWIGISIASCICFSLTIIGVPWLVRHLPVDYFVRPAHERSWAIRALRNGLGLVLMAGGIALLILPGPGWVTILLGLTVADFRAKDRLVRAIVLRPAVASAMQNIRQRAGLPPLALPAPRT